MSVTISRYLSVGSWQQLARFSSLKPEAWARPCFNEYRNNEYKKKSFTGNNILSDKLVLVYIWNTDPQFRNLNCLINCDCDRFSIVSIFGSIRSCEVSLLSDLILRYKDILKHASVQTKA